MMKLRSVTLMKSRLGTVIIGIPLTLLLFQPANVTTQSSSFNTRPELVFQSGHNSRVNCAVFSPDGRWLVSGGGDNTIRLWDTTSGAELRAFLGHSNWVKTLAVSGDGKKLASGSNDRSVRIWDVDSGLELQRLEGHDSPIEALVFSPDGRWLISGAADGTMKLWDSSNGRELQKLTGHIKGITVLAFSPDGKYLASGSIDSAVKVWDTTSWITVRTFMNHTSRITSLAFSPGGQRLAAGSADGRILFAEIENSKDRLAGDLNSIAVSSAAFRTETELLSLSADGSVVSWDAATGKEHRVVVSDGTVEENIFGVISHDFRLTASSTGSRTLDLRNAANGELIRKLESHSASFYAVAFSRDGRWLASGANDRTVRLWQMATGRELPRLGSNAGYVRAIAFSPDSRLLASGSNSGEVNVWNLNGRNRLAGIAYNQEQIVTVAFSQDGKSLAAAGTGRTVHLLDVANGETRDLRGHSGQITSVAFQPNSQVLASASTDKTVRFWHSDTGKLVNTVSVEEQVNAISFSPNGKVLAVGSADGKVTLLGLDDNKPRTLAGRGGGILSVAFSPDGRWIASGSMDRTVRLWDTAGGESRSLIGAAGEVNALAFSNDSRWLVSGNGSGNMIVWQVANGTLAASVVSVPGSDDWLVATPNGLFDGSPAAWKLVLWRFENRTFKSAPVESFFSEFYYPGLLADVFANKNPEAKQDIVRKDRRQPEVRIERGDGLQTNTKHRERTIQLRLGVAEAPPETGFSSGSGVQDLRLFRNGLLVRTWSGDVLDGKASRTIETMVPIVAGENRFTAYAFNRDNVKSKDDVLTVEGSETLRRLGTAYLIVAGVGSYANPQYNLNYSVADATAIGQQLKHQQELLARYQPIVVVSLLDQEATRANILLALKLLAGERVGSLPENAPPDLRKIKPAQPEDAVIFYFSGHGTAVEDRFYLIPHDLGYMGARSRIDRDGLNAIIRSSISDLELEQVLKPVDVDQLLLVIDACNSGQALNSEEQRRGPMNARGLAQLAYEKGMYVLTASQSDEVAFESEGLKHSYLAYALIEEGIKSRAADADRNGQVLLKEWFDYATNRVPQIGKQKTRIGKELEEIDPDERRVQRPRVFNMREGGAERFVIAGQARSGLGHQSNERNKVYGQEN